MSQSANVSANAEERKKRIAYIVFGVLFLAVCVYIYESFFATPTPAASTPVSSSSQAGTGAAKPAAGVKGQTAQATDAAQARGTAAAPGVAATKMASTSSSLDPTLDETAMLRTENLVYSGSGRNIFSTVAYVAPVIAPKFVPPARPVIAPVIVPSGPPPPPPINLKYFGTETNVSGRRQAFLLQGEDVYLASQGDIVARKYKIVSIGATSIQVEDLSNQNTQTLPLQAN